MGTEKMKVLLPTLLFIVFGDPLPKVHKNEASQFLQRKNRAFNSECKSMPGGEEFCREEEARQYPIMNNTSADSIYGAGNTMYSMDYDADLDPSDLEQDEKAEWNQNDWNQAMMFDP